MSFSCYPKSFARLFPVCLMWLAAASVAPVADAAQAKDYKELPLAKKYQMVEVDEDAENRRELTTINRNARAARRDDQKAVQAILLSGGNVNVPETQAFFDGYVFPSMTMEENLRDAGRLRYDFDRAYLGTKYVTGSRTTLIESILLPGLQKLVDNEELTPAARVNAVVLISRLDDSPLVRSSKTPPRPSLKGLDSLITMWQGDYPEYLKAAAFAGIIRHMEVDDAIATPRIPNDRKTQLMSAVTTAMDAILAADPELKIDLNRWKVSKSVELMSKSRMPAEAAAYFDRMSAMLAKDSKIPKWVKLEAIRGMRRLPLTGIAPEKINSVIESSLMYASSSLSEEAAGLKKRVDELIYDNILWDNVDLKVTGTNYVDAPKAPTGGPGMGGPGMGGPGMGGMGGPGMGMGGPGMGMGGMGGPGMGMGDEGGRGGPGGFPGVGEAVVEPIVELPNYELNLSRRRAKLVAFNVQKLLSTKAVVDAATDRHKAALEGLDQRFDEFMEEDSNIGFVDLAKVDEDEEPKTESYAMQLKTAFEGMSSELAKSVATMRGEKAPQAGEAADSPAGAPADTPFGG
ncbi:hypothetical protein [Mariniblastus fucicola]|uniref:Uncharacterized protein n=1 Tax=Mariniblastus fucicola TaxID=980251 RepID=A0A5B9P6J3_9BACT|nr:hypothetical protein [Mariniblastus fucicola]QEG20622.1 hypothetical protein MFFC18_04720 [Mariniblastus fucicola]